MLTACGGGGSGSSASRSPAPQVAAALSSGKISAFGSVFVNGHEFDTTSATVIDDDTGASSAAAAAGTLAVGMTVDVKPSSASTSNAPKAQEIHVAPLVRGPVDASDPVAAQLSVMGQVVQLASSSTFRDSRSCAQGSSPACVPVTDQAGLAALARCAASAGTYTCGNSGPAQVQVFGFLSGSGSGATVLASLVRVIDNTEGVFKASGTLSVASTGVAPANFTVAGLSVASSVACGGLIDCSLAAGSTVVVRGTAAPTASAGGTTLPIPVSFAASTLKASRSGSLTLGSVVEVEGVVSGASGTSYMVQGLTVTLGAGQALPANGDRVEVTGTVTSLSPPAITASAESMEDGASQHQGGGFLLADTLAPQAVTPVTPATTPPSYTLSILGATVTVTAKTSMEDETASTNAAFNINTFASYVNAYGGAAGVGQPYLVVRGYVDNSGSAPVLVASELHIVRAPASGAGFNARIDGVVTATSASDFSLDGLTVPFTGTVTDPSGAVVTLASGDFVRVKVTDTAGTLSNASVVDFGKRMDHGGD